MKTAAILSIGTELTRGELLNTNALWLAEKLTEIGFYVTEHVTIDDDPQRIVGTLKQLSKEVNVLISTGGLGPTSDDMTSAAAAEAAGKKLERDEDALLEIKKKWSSRRKDTMPESNHKQADFPEGSEIIENSYGMAPGFEIKINAAQCFFFPGVPREMKPMFDGPVLSKLSQMVEKKSHQEHIRTFGLTESKTAEKIAHIEQAYPEVTVGYRASFPEIEVKILAHGSDEKAAKEKALNVADEVREALGDVVYGGRDNQYAEVIGRALRERDKTLAIAESCTGGLVGSMLTDIPGASEFLLVDAVTYSNQSKMKILGVPEEVLRAHGAVSEEAAHAMAEGARALVDADFGVAVTGIAGPGGGTDAKPVGTVWIALSQKGKTTETKLFNFPYDRRRVRILSAYAALRMLFLRLK